mgnify:FL=1
MKRTLLSAALLALSLSSFAIDDNRITTMDLNAQQLAYYMAPGWNLGNTMEAGSNTNLDTNKGGLAAETAWQSTKTTQGIIDMVKAQGFKSIRIPCSWVMGHISDAATTQIDAAWMARVKEIVDYAIKADMYVIINDHWDGGWLEDSFKDVSEATVSKNSAKLAVVWKQIAEEFKDYDERLLFAGLNEPAHSSGLAASAYVQALKTYEETFIKTVRATGGNNAKRVLIVQGPATSIDDTYNAFGEMPSDEAEKRLMLEIHSYDPWTFCGLEQDESWGKMQYYWGTDHTLSGAGNRNATSNEKDLLTLFQKMKKYTDAGIPVVMGEYGANHRNVKSIKGQNQKKHDEAVAFWYEKATRYAMECGMIPFAWDLNYTGYPTFSLFDRSKEAVLDWSSSSTNIKVNGALEGIQKGAEAGREGYNKYYAPSSTGIQNVSQEKIPSNEIVYNLQGMKVAEGGIPQNAPKGIYIYKGKKIVQY